MNASKFRLNVILSVLLALGLLFAAAPRGVSAEGGQTLNVAKWGDATQINLAGRPTVLKVGETYHMWYGANDTTLYYTSGNSPTSFGDVKETTYNTKPVEVASPAIVEESGTYYMVAYGVTTTVFNIYTSTDGVAWTDQGQVFDGTGLTNWVKIDAPMLLADSGGYKLYFQVKSSAETNPYSIYVATATDTRLSDMAISASGKDFTLEKEVLPVGDPGAWDDWRLQHPWVVKDGANYYMWYVGYSHASTVQKLGFAYSKDGINWTKSAGNPVFDTRVAEPAVINDGGTWHLWYLDPASKISYRSSSAPFTMIQDAINAAADGDTLKIWPGTYEEHAKNGVVTGTKTPGKQINFIGETDESGQPLPVILGSLEINLSSSPEDNVSVSNINFKVTDAATLNLYEVNGITIDNCSFDGSALFLNNGKVGVQFTSGGKGNSGAVIQNSVFNNGLYVGIQGYVNDLKVTGSDLYNIKSGINFQGGNKLEVNDTDISVIAQGITNDTYAVRFTSSATNQMTITGGSFTVDRNDLTPNDGIYHSAIVVRGVAGGSHKVSEAFINGEVVNLLTTSLDASPNWWGSMYGPAAGQIVGEATYSPWCGDAACSFLVSKNDEGEFIIESEDNINVSGGIKIDQPNTTILLKNGTVIQNNSPCFIVNADNTTIKAESIGGAKCVPTDSAHGIDITGDRSGIRIINMEIDGSAQTTGDGIHFGGKITDFQIVDNFIHDLDGDGIEFAGTASGDPHEIQGNLFQNNGGLAINAGSNAINAEYNSWGQYEATTIATVDTDPWTHVDLYLTGAPYLNQAVNDREITVKVMANLKNVTGAAFELQYDSEKVDFVSATPTIAFEPVPEKISVLDASTIGLIKYDGYKGTGVTGAGIELYTVVFKAKALGEAALSFSPTTDKFSMSPTYGSSNYIYAAGLTGATVKVVDPPTITSSDIQGYYLTGETRDFYVLTENPSTGGDYQHALFKYVIEDATLGDIASFQYYTGSAWVDMQLIEEDGNLVGEFGIAPTGFHMIPGHSANTRFHIEFNTAKNYPFILTLVDKDADNYELARLDKTANVYTPPTLSSTFSAGPFLGGVEKDFTVTLNNPTTGINTDVKAKFTLYDALLADIAKIEYLEVPGDTWKDLPVSEDGFNLVGYFGPSSGFPMSLGYNATSNFRITFANDITDSYDYDIELFDTKPMPDRLLTKLSGTIDVYANYSLTGIFSMQGRTFRGGIPVTLTGVITGFGPYPLDSTDVLGVNWNLTDVAAGAYTITTSQPRYLNVTAALNKTIDVAMKTAIAALELKGGDATGDNIIGTGDASVIGTQYGSSGADKNADVNFSGKVDIFDLALVGGNFNLTSATAYGIGNNIWIP